MSLEVHPAGDIDKGAAVMRILDGEPQVVAAISLGDDRTDTTVWRALRQACAAGRLHTALAVGIQSDETPQIVRDSADLLVEGVAGSLGVLSALVPPHRP